MTFQNWIYILTEDYGCGKMINTYPNFKNAYEQIESKEKGNIIIDCGDNFRTAIFEAIRFGYDGYIYTRKYTITRDLLTIFPEDVTISPDMIKEIEKENDKKEPNNYRLKTEVI